ncbi:MAG: HAD-IA family hydrolase [Actinomycetota bacterium]|nr:HAD-IA family hydrolase [Actinomycetota bacterium]
MRYPTVLFDLDGTLIDSGAIILASFRHATRSVLDREIPDEILVASCGGATIHEQMRAFDQHRVDELVHAYRTHNEPLHAGLRPFAGVQELLADLVAAGRKLAIVTSKRRKTVDLAFAALPLERYFAATVTANDVERHKPHPDPVLLALERLAARPEETAFVGDSPFDVRAGKAAGVFTVGVLWGRIHPEERLLEAGADAVVDSVDELRDVL